LSRVSSLDRVAELLARSPLYAAMPAPTRRALAGRATRKRFRRGQRVLGEGDPIVITLVVGRVDVVAGAEIVRSLAPPATAGVSVAVGAPATAELWAAEDGELLSVPATAVADAIRRQPEAAIAAVAHLAGLVGELSAEIDVLRRHGLVARLRHRITVLARGRREVAITHDALASQVGGTRANVSRALARLEAEGWLRRRRGKIEIR
jgi:CRP-like cAMP-binding protein